MMHPLREWRERHGVGLDDMAKQVGVGASHLSMLERGLRGVSLELAVRLAAATGGEVRVDAFVRPPGFDSEVVA